MIIFPRINHCEPLTFRTEKEMASSNFVTLHCITVSAFFLSFCLFFDYCRVTLQLSYMSGQR